MNPPTPDRVDRSEQPRARRAHRPIRRPPRRSPRRTRTPDRVGRTARVRQRTAGAGRATRRAALGPARALRAILRYWRAERHTIRQGFVGLWISSGGDLIAGFALGKMTNRLNMLPGLLILVPVAIGMRGNIFGSVGSRLGTAIHAGLFRVTRDRSGVLYQNAYASIMLSIATAAFLAVAARIISVATGLTSMSVWDFFVISVIGGVASSAVVLALTVVLARIGYQRDWDLDAIAAPVVTFMGDTITLPALFAASYVAQHHRITLGIAGALAALSLWALISALRTRLPLARRIVRESLVVLAIAGTMDLFAGTVVQHRIERFNSLPALLVLIPPFLEDAGSLGSIVAARLGSKLHLGSIRPHLLPERLAWLDITLLAPWALSVFTLVGISSDLIAHAAGLATPGLLKMIEVSLLAGYLATLGAAIVAYATAVATFRFGLDPDNHGVPMVTSSIDLLGMFALVGSVVLLGVR
ncbi:MAG: magnesium transporter [Actinomycetota bacterium]